VGSLVPDVIEFFFDVASPWSYLASTQIAGLEERTRVTVRWRPLLLGGVWKLTGARSPREHWTENRRRYQDVDFAAWVEHYAIPFRKPSHFPPNTLIAMRGAVAAERLGRLVPYAHAGFRAYMVEDRNISLPEVVLAVGEGAGLDRATFEALLHDPGVKDALRANTEEAVARGAFGVPTFFWKGRMFFGNDRIALMESFIRHE